MTVARPLQLQSGGMSGSVGSREAGGVRVGLGGG